jgi:hypothetical protein
MMVGRTRSGNASMKRLCHGLIAGLVMGLVTGACADRPLEEEEEPPDIEGLCQTYCSRYMECVWTPESSFSTEDECAHNCRESVDWERTCAEFKEELLTCFTRYECPDFARNWGGSEGLCREEINEYSTCLPGEPR